MTGGPIQNAPPPEPVACLSPLNGAERYAVLQREAWERIIVHPPRFLELTLRRIGYCWLISPTYQITNENIVEPRYFYFLRHSIQILLLAVAFIGAMFAYRRHRAALLVSLWWLLAFTAPYAISVAGNTRYRLPVEPILLMLAVVACHPVLAGSGFLSRMEGRDERSLTQGSRLFDEGGRMESRCDVDVKELNRGSARRGGWRVVSPKWPWPSISFPGLLTRRRPPGIIGRKIIKIESRDSSRSLGS